MVKLTEQLEFALLLLDDNQGKFKGILTSEGDVDSQSESEDDDEITVKFISLSRRFLDEHNRQLFVGCSDGNIYIYENM